MKIMRKADVKEYKPSDHLNEVVRRKSIVMRIFSSVYLSD